MDLEKERKRILDLVLKMIQLTAAKKVRVRVSEKDLSLAHGKERVRVLKMELVTASSKDLGLVQEKAKVMVPVTEPMTDPEMVRAMAHGKDWGLELAKDLETVP